jgi:hypothetical protein
MESELLGVGTRGSLADAGNRLETIKEAIQVRGLTRKLRMMQFLAKVRDPFSVGFSHARKKARARQYE